MLNATQEWKDNIYKYNTADIKIFVGDVQLGNNDLEGELKIQESCTNKEDITIGSCIASNLKFTYIKNNVNHARIKSYATDSEHQIIADTGGVHVTGQKIWKATKKTTGTPPVSIGTVTIEPGASWTASIYVKIEKAGDVDCPKIIFYKDKALSQSKSVVQSSTDWQRIKTTYKNTTKEAIATLVYFYPQKEAGSITYFTSPKIETGEVDTVYNAPFMELDWSKEIKIDVGIKVSTGKFEYIPMGLFSCDNIDDKDEFVLKIVARDRIKLLDKDCTEFLKTITYPITLLELAKKACAYLKIQLENTTLVNGTYKIDNTFQGINLTFQKLFQWIGEASGTFVNMTRQGKIIFKSFKKNDVQLTSYDTDAISIAKFTVPQVTKLQVAVTDEDLGVVVGSGNVVYRIINNPLLYTISESTLKPVVQNILNQLKAIPVYIPMKISAKGNPTLESGDIISVLTNEKKVYDLLVMDRCFVYQKSFWDVYESFGTSGANGKEIKQGSIIQIQGKLNSLTRNLHENTLKIEDVTTGWSEINQTLDTVRTEIQNTKESTEQKITAVDKKLVNYYTKVETNTQITASVDNITLAYKKDIQTAEKEINSVTKELLKDYSTVKSTNSAILLMEDKINLGVASSITESKKYTDDTKTGLNTQISNVDKKFVNYYNKTQVDAQINTSVDGITLSFDKKLETKETVINANTNTLLKSYSTKQELNSAISVVEGKITLGVNSSIETSKSYIDTKVNGLSSSMDNKLTNYYNKTQVNTLVDAGIDGVMISYKKDIEENKQETMKDVNANYVTYFKHISDLEIVENQIAMKIKSSEETSKTYADTKISGVDNKVNNLDGTVKGLDGTVKGLDSTVKLLDGSIKTVDGKLINYYTKTQTDAQISASTQAINIRIDQKATETITTANNYTTTNLQKYSTTAQMTAAIQMANAEADIAVSKKIVTTYRQAGTPTGVKAGDVWYQPNGKIRRFNGSTWDVVEDYDIQNIKSDIAGINITTQAINQKVENANGKIGSLEITASGISSRVSGVEGNISTVRQTTDNIAWAVNANKLFFNNNGMTINGNGFRITNDSVDFSFTPALKTLTVKGKVVNVLTINESFLYNGVDYSRNLIGKYVWIGEDVYKIVNALISNNISQIEVSPSAGAVRVGDTIKPNQEVFSVDRDGMTLTRGSVEVYGDDGITIHAKTNTGATAQIGHVYGGWETDVRVNNDVLYNNVLNICGNSSLVRGSMVRIFPDKRYEDTCVEVEGSYSENMGAIKLKAYNVNVEGKLNLKNEEFVANGKAYKRVKIYTDYGSYYVLASEN